MYWYTFLFKLQRGYVTRCNMSYNTIATQVAEKIPLCNISVLPFATIAENFSNHCKLQQETATCFLKPLQVQPKIAACKGLGKLPNVAWETLLFVSESLAMDRKVTPDLRRKQ